MTIDAVIQDAKDEVNVSYGKEYNDILFAITTIIDDLQGKWPTGKTLQSYTVDELSRIAGTLAVYRASLEAFKTESSRNVAIFKNRMDFRKSSLRPVIKEEFDKKKNKYTVDDVNAEIQKQMIKITLLHDFHLVVQERVTSVWYSIPTVIDTINTRIKVLLSDKDTAKYYDAGYDVELQ